MSEKQIPQTIQHFWTTAKRGGQKGRQHALPILNGLMGDQLGKNNPLAISLQFRDEGQDVAVKDLLIPADKPAVTIFVHGLMLDETCWVTGEKPKAKYGATLQEQLGHVVLYVRYNTGLHISQNGRAFAQLLQTLVAIHGKKISTLNLVGHSMGGLVIRSAGHYGIEGKHQWMEKVKHAVLIGSPQGGSHWEQLGHLTSTILKTIWNFHTRLIGKLADRRSNGIKDLRRSFMLDEDWQHADAADIFYVKPASPQPLPGVKYHVIAGSLDDDEASLTTRFFGDGLVSNASATRETLGTFKLFAKTNHMQLLNSPEIAEYLKELFQ